MNRFETWRRSAAFRERHSAAGDSKSLSLGPPQFEGFDCVLSD